LNFLEHFENLDYSSSSEPVFDIYLPSPEINAVPTWHSRSVSIGHERTTCKFLTESWKCEFSVSQK